MADDATLQITAKLYPVGVELHARPGDKVIIAAGVVVGVYTGEPRRLPAPTKPAAEAPAKAAKVAKSAKPAKPGRARETRKHFREEVLRVLTEKGPTHATSMLDSFPGIRSSADLPELKAALRELRMEGRIIAVGYGPQTVYRLPRAPEEPDHAAA